MNLTNLSSLTWCVKLTDEAVKHLGAHLHNLETLSLHGLLKLTNASIEALAKVKSPLVLSLLVQSFSISMQGCRKLAILDVNGCAQISPRTLSHFQSLFPVFKHLQSL